MRWSSAGDACATSGDDAQRVDGSRLALGESVAGCHATAVPASKARSRDAPIVAVLWMAIAISPTEACVWSAKWDTQTHNLDPRFLETPNLKSLFFGNLKPRFLETYNLVFWKPRTSKPTTSFFGNLEPRFLETFNLET